MIKVIAFDLVGVLVRGNEITEPELFKTIKENYPEIKIVVATNNASCIRDFIGKSFGYQYVDDFFISREMNKIKPDPDYFEHILNKFNIKSEEMLFLDDSLVNITSAKDIGINVIKVEKDTKLIETVINWLEANK